jgi:hypothetical protein
MQTPPKLTCGSFNIDRGLAEASWLRKIRFPHKTTETYEPTAVTKDDDTPKADSHELSVERRAQGLMATPIATAQHPTLRVPSVLCQPYTLGDRRLGILLVNRRPETEEIVLLPVDPVASGLPQGN